MDSEDRGEEILLGHGGGGRLSRDLVEQEIISRFKNPVLETLGDSASLSTSGSICFSTDSFVVQPMFFPGGDIGELAIYGTANDLAVSGAKPRWLSLGLILEEGLSRQVLARVLDSAKKAAERCHIQIVAGDTKVVRRGDADGLYINTAGIGEPLPEYRLSHDRISPGDAVVVSGTIGEHGLAVMCAREGLKVKNPPNSDAAPVQELVFAARSIGSAIKLMRDPTRGGVAAVLNEFVAGRSFGITLEEAQIPVRPNARALSEMLGFDPLHIACEGRIVAVCDAAKVSELMKLWNNAGADAMVIGEVTAEPGRVVMKTLASGRRLVDIPSGELLPRIC